MFFDFTVLYFSGDALERKPKNSYPCYIKDTHSGFAFLTGRISGMTVIDVDSSNSYSSLTAIFPQLLQTFTVKTRQGYHIYCSYEPALINNTNSFNSYPHVDIRNDGGIIFAPPTVYTNCLTGQEEQYQVICDAEGLQAFPEGLKRDAKHLQVVTCVVPSIPIEDEDSNVFQEEVLAPARKLVESFPQSETTCGEIEALLRSLPDSCFDGFNDWYKIGAIKT